MDTIRSKEKIRGVVIIITSLIIAGLLMGSVDIANAAASKWVIKSEVFRAESTAENMTTAEGMCIDTDDNNAIYTTQRNGTSGKTSLFKNGKVVKTAFKSGNSYVEASTILEHANDLAYYKNHLYVASYGSSKIYRMKRYNGAYTYEKTYTLKDNAKAWNITTYKKAVINGSQKQLFVIGTSGNNKKTLSFKIAYFRDTDNKFVTVGNFTVQNPNSSISSTSQANIFQGIAYKPDTSYLQICLSNKNQQGNKIVAVKLTMTTGSKAYLKKNEVIRAFDVTGKEKFELESIAVDSNYKYYALVNEKGAKDPVYAINIVN